MKRTARVYKHHTQAERDRILAAYERSGLTQEKFAAQCGIGHSTLTLWLKKKKMATTAKESGPVALVSVPNLFSAAAAPPAYRLQFPRGMIVEVAPGFQSGELGALLQLVQQL